MVVAGPQIRRRDEEERIILLKSRDRRAEKMSEFLTNIFQYNITGGSLEVKYLFLNLYIFFNYIIYFIYIFLIKYFQIIIFKLNYFSYIFLIK